jgi:FixJ family two-component response regulator
MRLVMAGLLNKQIAGELGISERTIKAHRSRVMEKMGAASIAELVLRAQKAGVAPASSGL